MMPHAIYIFGSICRGEIDIDSDIDALIVTADLESREGAGFPDLSEQYSIYTEGRIRELWSGGNPFAWHLALESKLVFVSPNYVDIIQKLALPAAYAERASDCRKFLNLVERSRKSIQSDFDSCIFDLGMCFLGMRNFATCYMLNYPNSWSFSRDSARILFGDSQPIDDTAYSILRRARILSTRGRGEAIRRDEVEYASRQLPSLEAWMRGLMEDLNG